MKKFFYRVDNGDTVSNVAERFNLLIAELIKDNNLIKDIECGDILYIQPCEKKLYKVQPTDTIEQIAKRFSRSPKEILSDNQIDYIFYGLNIKV